MLLGASFSALAGIWLFFSEERVFAFMGLKSFYAYTAGAAPPAMGNPGCAIG